MKIFLVEDNSQIRANLIDYLESLIPVQIVGWAGTQEDSLRWFDGNNECDLVVLDLFLTKGNGLGVLIDLKRRFPDLPVVMLTNYATSEIRARCIALRADAVFDKLQELDKFVSFAKAKSHAATLVACL